MYSRDFTPLNQQIPEIFPQLAHHNMTANTAQIDEGYAAQNMPRPHVAGPNAVHAAPYSALQGAAYLPPRPEPIVTAAQSHPLQNGVAAPSGRSSTIDSLHNAGNAHRITNTRDRSRLSMSAQRNPGNHIAGTQQQHSISKVLSNSARGSPKVKPYSNLYSSDEHAAASLMLGALRSPKRSKYIPMGNWEKGRSIPNAVQNAAGVKAPTQQDIAGMINDSQHDSTILQEMGNYYPPNVDNEGHFSARTGNRIAGNEGPLMSVPSSSIGAFKEEMILGHAMSPAISDDAPPEGRQESYSGYPVPMESMGGQGSTPAQDLDETPPWLGPRLASSSVAQSQQLFPDSLGEHGANEGESVDDEASVPHTVAQNADSTKSKAKRTRKGKTIFTPSEAEVPIPPLPDYTNVKLRYCASDDAQLGFKDRLVKLKINLDPPKKDPSVPKSGTGSVAECYVKWFKGALMSVKGAADEDSAGFRSRYGDDADKPYEEDDYEATAWALWDCLYLYHTEGFYALRMHDPWFYTHVEASQHLLLDNRAKYIATICAEHKARCDDLLKNKTIEAIVLGPIYALYISRENRLANKRRAADNIEAKALKQEKRREALERGEKEAEDVTPAEKPKRARRSRQSAQQPKATRITGGNKRKPSLQDDAVNDDADTAPVKNDIHDEMNKGKEAKRARVISDSTPMGPGSSLLEEAARFDQSRLVAEDGITAAGSANHLSASNTTSYPAIPCADAQQMVSNGTSTFFDNDKLLSSSGMVYNIEYKSISSARQQNDSLPQPAGEPRATVFEPRITRTPFTAVDDRNETHAPEALPVYHISLEVAEAMVLAGRANLMDDGAYLVTDDSQFFVVDGAEQMLEGAEEGEAEREQSTWDGGESDAGGLDDEDEL